MESPSIFDCHHHVGLSLEFMGKSTEAYAVSAASDASDEMTQRIAIMDAAGVAQAVVIPGHGYDRSLGIESNREVNTRIAAYRDRCPERFPVALGIIEPYPSFAVAELRRCKNELGLKGVSFHARFQGISMDSPWVFECIEAMVDLDLLPVLHAMTEASDEALWKITQVARTYPEVTMLVLDSFSTFEGTKETPFVAELCPNLIFDTSLSYTFDYIENFIKRFGAHRVMFGTDLYSPPMGRRISPLLNEIAESSLTHEEKSAVLGDNARRFFGLP
jgi:uncharacterized protein